MDYHALAACLTAHIRMNADPDAPPPPPSDEQIREDHARWPGVVVFEDG